MASQTNQDLQALRQELRTVVDSLSHMQERVVEITRRSEEEIAVLQNRVNQLETQNREILNATKWLRAQNAELERKARHRNPETEKALAARDAAIRKLRHTRKVIKDLLDERKMGFALWSANDEVAGGSLHEAEGRIDVDEEILGSIEGHSHTDSGSESTVRLSSQPSQSSQPNTPHRRPARRSGAETISEMQFSPPESLKSENSGIMATETSPPGRPSSSISVHPTSANKDSRKQPPWELHYGEPPASTELSFGPLSWTDLPRVLGLDEDTAYSLASLASDPDYCLHLQIEGDLAFVYDPILLEAESATYIIDWGRTRVNQRIAEHITKGNPGNLVFHTFTFPVEKNFWYYVGAHTWTVRELWAVWPTLRGKSRRKLTKKLRERGGGRIAEKDIAQLLDSGELSQFCVEISSDSHLEKSRALGRKMGYQSEI